MVVPILIIVNRPLLDAFLGRFQVNADHSVLSPLCGKDSQLHSVQRRSGVSIGRIRQKIHGLLIHHGLVSAHSPLHIRQSPADQLLYILLIQGLQLENPRPGQKSAIYLKIGIFRGSPDENQGAVLNKGEQIILLPLVKAVNLIHKENCSPAVHPQVVLGGLDHLFHILFPCHGGVDLLKIRAGGIGDYLGQGGFARARRPVKDQGTQLVRLNRPV